MSTTLLSQIPLVLDGKDLPFVIGFGDGSPFLDVEGFELRRGPDTCHCSLPIGQQQLRLTTMITATDGNFYLFASVGTFLAEWWSFVTAGRPIAGCPILTEVGAGRSVILRFNDLDVPLNVLLTPEPAIALVGFASAGDLDDEVITLGVNMSAAICGVALRLLVEYRAMVRSVPDVNVSMGDRLIPLAVLIDAAEELIPSLPGEVRA